MVEKHDRIWALYPEYFDSSITRQRGRRVKRNIAIPSPTLDELYECARGLNLSPIKEKDVAYPAFWWKNRGRLLVRKEWAKSIAIGKIAEQLVELRKKRGTPDQAQDSTKKREHIPKRDPHRERKTRWKDRKKGKKGKRRR